MWTVAGAYREVVSMNGAERGSRCWTRAADPEGATAMTQPPAIRRGSVVIHVDDGEPVFRRAVAIGPVLVDPDTDVAWVALARANGTVTMTDAGSVVDVLPDDAPSPLRFADPHGPVGVLARALDRLAAGLIGAGPDGRRQGSTTPDLLAEFVCSAAPVEQALRLLAESDPDNGLAVVLGWLSWAGNEYDAGNLAGVVSGVLLADGALKRTCRAWPVWTD
jgi:hypothetical protein